ncbi:biosynthetic-type acetolactate synthase large subunit [Hydrogenophaga sp.]|uniref:biosynthetic-type acetolactate synthase large subunit n=1 Tax=Hydrogenophaga sp. TaxID=1904254 RepID=UPI0025BDCBB1|nr:biosynthetic-type acetolactate synthase large subunit [Hydrogenophaga sp.]MBT9465636.1 biosynthetic-type acetolactate synthase large subunit [Hydrogenophaga sp.]
MTALDTPLHPLHLLVDESAAPTTITGAALLIRTLLDLGVDTVFGYPGGAVLPLYDALHGEPRLRHVLVRHEQAAVHAAQGYARTTGKPGVVFVTSGPGMSNTTTGLLDALSDSIPVLCISGQVATTVIGTNAFQECDALGISRSVTKWNVQIRQVDAIVDTLRQAWRRVTTGRPGPVLVDFPKDIQLQDASSVATRTPASRVPGRTETPLPQNQLTLAAELIANAKRPVFYGGGGLINSGPVACRLFAELVRETGAPCTLTLLGLGAFPGRDPQFLGMLGMHGTLEANLAMHHADLVINVGARFDDRITGTLDTFCPNAKKIHIDIDPNSINKVVKVDVPITADCETALEHLLGSLRKSRLAPSRLDPWWAQIQTWRDRDCLAFEDRSDAILPQRLLSSLNRQLQGTDAIVSTDVGQHQMWSAQYLQVDAPMRWLTSGGAGTMGYGLPAAIGAQVAHPDKLVVCVSGDASILMNIQELSTARQHGTPVKVVLCNNGSMGMVRQWQQLIHGGRYSHSYTASLPDFVALARSFGWQSARVERPEDLEAALAACLASTEPYFLDVVVASDENCFPMMPAGCGHHEILLKEGVWYRP